MKETKRKKREFSQGSVNEFFSKASNEMEYYLKNELSKAKTLADKKRIKALLKDFS